MSYKLRLIFFIIILSAFVCPYISPIAAAQAEVNAYSTYLKADHAFRKGDIDKAIELFNQTLGQLHNNLDIKNSVVLKKLVMSYLMKGDLDKAQQIAAWLNDQERNILTDFIEIVSDLKHEKFAAVRRHDFDNCSASIIDYLTYVIFRSWADYGEGNLQQANDLIKNILSLSAKKSSSIDKSNKLERRLYDFLRDRKNRDIVSLLLYYNLALLNYKDHPEQAEYYFKNIIKLYPQSVYNNVFFERVILNYSYLLAQQKGRIKDLEELLLEAKKRYPNNLVILDIINSYLSHDMVNILKQDAVFAKDDTLKNNSVASGAKRGAAELVAVIGSLLDYVHGTDAAWLYDEFAVELDARSPIARWQYASLVSKRNANSSWDIEEALKQLALVDNNSVYYFAARLRQCLLLVDLGKIQLAIDKMLSFRQEYKEKGDKFKLGIIYFQLVSLYENSNQIDIAADIMANWLSRPEVKKDMQWAGFFEAATLFAKKNDVTRSSYYYDLALEKSQDNVLVLNNYAYMLLEHNCCFDKALLFLQKANKLQPNNFVVLDSLGWAYYLRKDYKNSLFYLEKAVDLAPKQADIIEHLGDLYWRLGRYEAAKAQWREASLLNRDPLYNQKLEIKIKVGLAPTAK